MKLFARLEAFNRETTNTAGCLTLVIEWKQIAGEIRGGKVTLPNVKISHPDRLRNLVREMLIDSLNAAYPGENFKERELSLVGI